MDARIRATILPGATICELRMREEIREMIREEFPEYVRESSICFLKCYGTLGTVSLPHFFSYLNKVGQGGDAPVSHAMRGIITGKLFHLALNAYRYPLRSLRRISTPRATSSSWIPAASRILATATSGSSEW